MNPNRRCGLDVTWRCNWSCRHCFYRFDDRLHHPVDIPLIDLLAKVDLAQQNGLEHVVLVGYGEPTLYPDLGRLLDACRERGMATSIITNGVSPLETYQRSYREWGLDHLHISSHGIGPVLDAIVERPGAYQRQRALKEWLAAEALPFRTNVTLQQANYRILPELMEEEVSLGAFHCVLLGFLPHYGWHDLDKCRGLAVHPALLRPYIEAAADVLIDAGTLFTIRYTPFCHLGEEYWPFVVNARYVFFDSTEWNYELQATDVAALWEASVRCGESVACKTSCNKCLAYRHCGGWNQTYAEAFNGADLRPIREVPAAYSDVWDRDGGLHDLNPATRIPSRIRVLPTV